MTIKTSAAAVAILASSLLLSGCIISVDGEGIERQYSSWQKQEKENRQQIAQLEPGMMLDKVVARMGEPDFSEAVEQDGKTLRVLYYRTHRQHEDGMTTKEECTPLIFNDEVLSGWGDAAYRSTF